MVVRGEGDVGRVAPATAPAAFVPSRAHSYPPRSLVPPCSFVPPVLPSYLLTLIHTVPAARLYTLGPAHNPRTRLVLIRTPLCMFVPPTLVCHTIQWTIPVPYRIPSLTIG
jgi:hypothetical protein